MRRIIFATGNENKLKEIRMIMADMDVEIVSMKEAGVYVDVEETGTTFEENSILKAKAIAIKSGELTLADDSGLEIDYLNKEPGIYSARYMGEDTSYHIKNLNLIDRIKDARDGERSARYVCAVACVLPNGSTLSCVETMEGRIGYEERGTNGFGFDPIFLVPPYEKTAAELSPEEKNAISHRGKALRGIKEEILKYYE